MTTLPDGPEPLVEQAAGGDRDALEQVLGRYADEVYSLAFRMLGSREDAEDACQEILLKVATGLPGFRGESSLRTWVWRIAVNHLRSTRRSAREQITFEGLDQMLEQGLRSGLPTSTAPEQPLLEEEVKLGCTHSMMLSLDRDQRAAFVLGAVLDLPGEEAADVLGIDHAAYRKRLSRARTRMREFMERRCGLVEESAECRCGKQVAPCLAAGVVDPDRLVYTTHPTRRAVAAYDTLARTERYLEVLRSHPEYAAPQEVRAGLRRLVERL